MSKALAVYRKELRQISRDRRTLTTIVFVPAFFLLLYGYALNWDIRHIALGVQDRDGTAESRGAGLRVRQLRLLRSRRRRPLAGARSIACSISTRRAPCWSFPRASGATSSTGRAAAGAGAHQRRQRQHRHDRDGLRRQHRPQRRRLAVAGRASGGPAHLGRAAHLVQPGAAQHALPRARADRLHPDDHRGHLDGALDRPREGERDDGAGADGADRHLLVRRRQEHSRTSSSRSPRRR